MIALFARAGPWLFVQAALGDTVLMRQVGQTRPWYDTATSIAALLALLAVTVLLFSLVPAAWSFRRSYQKVSELVDKAYGDATPFVRHATSIADNVNHISASVRNDVQLVHGTIASANERIRQAVMQTETRLNELNALLAVVQEEAETMFVATASTVRGVRTGAAALHREDIGDAAHAAAPTESEEFDDGTDDISAPTAGTTRPRVRPGRRGRA